MKFRVSFLASALTVLCVDVGMAQPVSSPTTPAIKLAVERAIPALTKTISEYPNKVRCFSCHHQGATAVALSVAGAHGFAGVSQPLASVTALTKADLHQDIQMYRTGDGQPGGITRAGYALLALKSAGVLRDESTDAVVDYMLRRDKAEGFWRGRSNRPPAEFSNFTDTFLCVQALRYFGDDSRKDAITDRISRAREWLQKSAPKETEDRVFRLWGLQLTGADSATVASAANDLLKTQQPDGGWRQLDTGSSDAYATSTSLTALSQTHRLTPRDPAFLHAIQYLLSTQLPDGTWHVVTRSHPVQPYFESGFPHGKDQFISVAATAWSVVALCLAEPASHSNVQAQSGVSVRSSATKLREKKARPIVWVFPPAYQAGEQLLDMVNRPSEWAVSRKMIDGVGYADLNLNKQYSDDQLRQIFARLAEWKLKLCLETGAIKPWATTAEGTMAAERPLWNRFIRLGGKIDAIDTDEPLCCTRSQLPTRLPDNYAVEQTALYYQMVRKEFPHTCVGDTEPYPYLSPDEIINWLTALQHRLTELHEPGIETFKLDVDWAGFELPNGGSYGRGSWAEVKKIEEYCRAAHIQFKLIYWAADQPSLSREGKASDATWLHSILKMATNYRAVGGNPASFVVESWIEAPPRALPDTLGETFMGSVEELCRTFVPGRIHH